ncbi:MAG: hypothetical protein MUE51_16140 [Thermoleophilia bacterium]|jgi:hypothetical protein|nr:hypothetical protein [Thermoleophilia bacterium]
METGPEVMEAFERAHAAAWCHILDARDAAAEGRLDLEDSRASLDRAITPLPESRRASYLGALEQLGG